MRMLVSIESVGKMGVKHLDIKITFLYGEIKGIVYMKQPPRFEKSKDRYLLCKLQKSIPGLRQTTRHRSKKLHQILIKEGFGQGKV